MATAKPLQAWAMEQAERARREQQPNTAEILAPALAAIPKFREDKTPPLHDWQKSAERGAEFAQQGELQRRKFAQQKELQDREVAQRQDMLRLQAELKAKYRPRGGGRGGVGPVTKLTQEYLKLWQSDPPKDEQQAYGRRQRMEMIRTQLQRLGKSGQAAVADFEGAQLLPDKYRLDATKRTYEQQTEQGRAEARKAETQARVEQEAAKAEVQALSRMLPKRDAFELPEAAAERTKREKELQDAIKRLRNAGGTSVSFGGKSYMRLPDGNFVELEADGMED